MGCTPIRNSSRSAVLALGIALGAVCVPTARAQNILPHPEQPFGGKIGRTTKESVKDFPKSCGVLRAPV